MFRLRVDEETELELRSEADVEAFFQLTATNRVHLSPWLPWARTNTIEDTRNYIRKCEADYEAGTKVDLGIKYKGKWVGSIGLNDISNEHRKAEIGYWLDEGWQGKGIITRAVQALVDYGFGELNLNRVWLYCATDNEKSAAVPRRLGFTHEGTLRQYQWMGDHFEDTMVWSLLRSEWQKMA